MAEIQKSSFSVFALAFVCSALVLLWPALVCGSMESVKSDMRDYGNTGSGNVGFGGQNALSPASTKNGAAGLLNSKRNLRSVYGLGPKMLQISRSKIPIELDLLVENEDGDRSKRFDDYGHMRFGKRFGEEQFDDYGHMRFGRST